MQGSAAPICVLALGVIACGKKPDEAKLAPAASALTASRTNPATTTWHYVVDPKSATRVDMPGLKEHIKGRTDGAGGTLDIVPTDLSLSRGIVRVDLATFATDTFGDSDKDATQTKHARTWLEAVVDGKINEDLRWAEFAIRTIDGLSATDVTMVGATKDSTEDVRTVTMTVHGDLLIHGHKLPKDDVVDVRFHYPAGAPAASEPPRIEIKSRQPMRVLLKEHDVAPRDPAGQLLAWTTSLVSKVADTADVTIAMTATPMP
jgi:hypothetical protein